MSRLVAIISDIHSNIDAFATVLEDSQREGVTEYVCLGDVVGYNAEPGECLRWVREMGMPVVKGNHDDYIADRERDLSDFNPNAAAVIEWTRGQLTDEEIDWLGALPYSQVRAGMTLVHSTMDNPENFGYVFDNLQAESNFIFQKTPLSFHGHTHCPIIYEKSMNGVVHIDIASLPDSTFRLMVGRKYFINVGSVGQPRDGDPRASYAIYDPVARTVRFRRLEYDVAAAQSRILAAGLPERLAERLAEGR